MKLTDDETQILYRLKKEEHAWCVWGKWITLLLGIFYAFLFFKILMLLAQPHVFRSVLVPDAIFALGVSVLAIVYATQNWAGTMRTLYIKIIDSAIQPKE